MCMSASKPSGSASAPTPPAERPSAPIIDAANPDGQFLSGKAGKGSLKIDLNYPEGDGSGLTIPQD
jgi:hypothetical protein